MSPIAICGGVAVRAHSLYTHCIYVAGREVAAEVDAEITRSTRRGCLCVVHLGGALPSLGAEVIVRVRLS